MVIFHERGVLLENGTFLRFKDMFLERDHAAPPTKHEQFVEHFQQFLVSRTIMRRTFQA